MDSIEFFVPAVSNEWKIANELFCENEDHLFTWTYMRKVVSFSQPNTSVIFHSSPIEAGRKLSPFMES